MNKVSYNQKVQAWNFLDNILQGINGSRKEHEKVVVALDYLKPEQEAPKKSYPKKTAVKKEEKST